MLVHQPALGITPPELKPCRVSRPLFREIKKFLAEYPSTPLDWPAEASEVKVPDGFNGDTGEWTSLIPFLSNQKTYDQFRRGLTDGFAIKRYRVAFHYAPTEHSPNGTQMVIRESENVSDLQQYVTELLAAYSSKGYVIKKDDNGNAGDYGIYQIGGIRRHCILRLSLIKDRPTQLAQQKDPEPTYVGTPEEGEAVL